MRGRHLLLVLVVVVVWGLNFLFVKVALHAMSPLTLLLVRFVLSTVPAIFFVERPRVPFRVLAKYGLTLFTLQFAFMFCGMRAGVTPGLASLIVQVQVFFTMGHSAWLFKERPHVLRWVGALVAFGGIGVVAAHTNGDVTAGGLVLIVLAALSAGVGNIAAQRAGGASPISLVVWGNAVAIAPMLVLALAFEGPSAMAASVAGPSAVTLAALAYIVYGSTFVGYSLWSFLMSRYSASTVVPFTLLVPVVALFGSIVAFGEALPPWKLAATALVVVGVGLNLLGPRAAALLSRVRRRVTAPIAVALPEP